MSASVLFNMLNFERVIRANHMKCPYVVQSNTRKYLGPDWKNEWHKDNFVSSKGKYGR